MPETTIKVSVKADFTNSIPGLGKVRLYVNMCMSTTA